MCSLPVRSTCAVYMCSQPVKYICAVYHCSLQVTSACAATCLPIFFRNLLKYSIALSSSNLFVMASPPTRPPRDSEVFPDLSCRLILIGKTGSGKSATGNKILGKDTFISHTGVNSMTKECKLDMAKRFLLEIQVMDTPGLADTDGSDEIIGDLIIRSLCAVHPGPHAVLLVLRCDSRFTPEEFKVYQLLKSIFGDQLPSYTIVIFVGKDRLDRDKISFEEQLSQCSPNLRLLLDEVNNRYVLFDNRTTSKEKSEEQVERLILQVKHLVRQNGNRCFKHHLYTSVSVTMDSMMQLESSNPKKSDPKSKNREGRNIRQESETGPVTMERDARLSELDEVRRLRKGDDEKNVKVLKERLDTLAIDFENWTAENALKRKIVNHPEELTRSQQAVLEESGKSTWEKFKEKMTFHSVRRIDPCSVM